MNSQDHIAKKSLGQNFLIDKNMILKIIKYIDPKDNEKIVEIGPGFGALTDHLSQSVGNLVLIELDTKLADLLNEKYSDNKNIKVIKGNILKIDWKIFLPIDKIVGNLPYNISSQIIIKMFQHRKKINSAIITIQKEFAERLVSAPKSKKYGILSVYNQLYCDAKILFKISNQVFRPIPKVESTLIEMKFNKKLKYKIDDLDFFHKIVRTAFNQRRKQLRNSLSVFYRPDLKDKFDWKLRAEAIDLKGYFNLYKLLINSI